MKRLELIFIFLLSQLVVPAQQDFGVKLNGGISKVEANRNLTNPTKLGFAPSGHGGLFYNLHLGKRSSIGLELLFMQIEGKEHMKIIYTDRFGVPTGEYGTDDLNYHISYLSLPIYYGFKVKKFTFNIGAQAGIVLANNAREKTRVSYNGEPLSLENEGRMNIDVYDFGARAGIIYNLYKKFSVEAVYYYGINNILAKTAPAGWNWTVQQLTLGVRYKIFTIKKTS
jgi:opacity protein-like surface antigen